MTHPASRAESSSVTSPLTDLRPPSVVASLRELVAAEFKFGTIYADPPWDYSNRASRGAARKHYRTMSFAQIKNEPVADLAAERAHLHLWTTNGFLRRRAAVRTVPPRRLRAWA